MATVFALLALAPAVFAQVTAAISGKIVDASGAGMSAVAVTVKSLETGATRAVTTNDAGDFRALSLPIGPYQVRAAKSGFKTQVRNGVTLVVGQDAVVNLRLEVGDLAQEVTVTEEIPVVNTTTSSVSGLVGEREVKDLPLNGRSFDNLMSLNPGVISYGLKSANTSTSNGNTFTVAGRRPMDNLLLLNGIEYTEAPSQLAITPGGVSDYLLGIEAVREFNVQTDTYGAAYGKRMRAERSGRRRHAMTGTNAVHGALFGTNSCATARSILAAFSPKSPVLPRFARTSSAARSAATLRRIASSCSAITKASARRKPSAASASCQTLRFAKAFFPPPSQSARSPPRRLSPRRQSEPRHAAVFLLLASCKRRGTALERPPQRHRVRCHPSQAIHPAKTSELSASTTRSARATGSLRRLHH